MNVYLSATPVDLPGRKRCLRTFVALDASNLDAGTNSGWAQVAMLGEWEGHSKGSFAFTKEVFAEILKNFSNQSNPIPWDYEHDTFNFDTTGPKPASGWVRRLELRNNGTELWAYVDWTPRAAQMIRAGEYRFSSPVVDFASLDRRTNEPIGAELLSVALTNNPFLDGQHPIQLTWVAAAVPPEEKQSAEPKGPPQQQPPQHGGQPPFPPKPDDQQKPMAAPPPPVDRPPPPPPAAADPQAAEVAQGDGSAADANALLTALADAAGLDKAQTLAALLDLKDQLVNAIQKTVSRDGTPAEMRTMTIEKQPETQAQPPAATTPAAAPAAPAATDTPTSLDELERKRDKEAIAALSARLEALEAERAAEKNAALEALVDQKIAAGFIPATQRDTAIWAFKQDRKRAEEIYSQQLIPIGTRQTQAPAPAAGAAPATTSQQIDMSQFSKQELMTIDCLIGAHRTREQAIAIVMKRRS